METLEEFDQDRLKLIEPSSAEVEDALRSVFTRRILKSHDRLRAISRRLASQPDYSYLFRNDSLLLLVHPRSEKNTFNNLKLKYGSPCPGLYSVANRSIDKFNTVGTWNIDRVGPGIVTGAPNFQTTIRSRCLLNLQPDARISVEGIKYEAIGFDDRAVSYSIYLCYIVSFGSKFNKLFLENVMDDFVVSCLIYKDELKIS